MDNEIKQKLIKFFQESAISKLYTFLKTPRAKQVVKFEPEKLPNEFTLKPSIVQEVCPQLRCANLIFKLKLNGLVCRQGSKNFYKITHKKLNLLSTDNQIMAEWLEFQIQQFFKRQSQTAELMRMIYRKHPRISWNNRGDVGIFNLEHLDRKTRKVYMNRLLLFCTTNVQFGATQITFTHPYLHRDAPIEAYLLVYLEWRSKAWASAIIGQNEQDRCIFKDQTHTIEDTVRNMKIGILKILKKYIRWDMGPILSKCDQILNFSSPKATKQQIKLKLALKKNTV